MSDRQPDHVAAFASGMWRRLRDVILVAERIEDYAFRAEQEGRRRPAVAPGEADRLALDLTVRAFRLAGDGTNWQILSAAASADAGAPVEQLASACALPRLAITERANELIQAGLCVRAIDADRILVTEAGEALVGLVTSVAEAVVRRADEAGRRGEEANGERPLPMV